MAHLGYRKGPSGSWLGVTEILPADMTYFDQTLAKCVNGDEGGTWAPTSPIIIGGSGLTANLVGTTHVLSGGHLTIDAGATLNFASGSALSYPKQIIDDFGFTWTGSKTWTTTTYAGGALEDALGGRFTGYQDGDVFDIIVQSTITLKNKTIGSLRLRAYEDASHGSPHDLREIKDLILDADNAAAGYKVWSVTLMSRYIKAETAIYGNGIEFRIDGAVTAVGDQAAPSMSDYSTNNSVNSARILVWRP